MSTCPWIMGSKAVTAQILDGKKLSSKIVAEVKRAVKNTIPHLKPTLLSLSIGMNDPSSRVYIASQKKISAKTGIEFREAALPAEVSRDELFAKIDSFNRDKSIHGVIMQRPFPADIDPFDVISELDPNKDVEGLHPANLGSIVHGKPGLTPCTAEAAVRLFRSTGIESTGLEVVIVGHSEIVGKPISLLMVHELATTTVCHIATRDLKAHTERADLLFVAAGVPGLIRADMVKAGAIVIDIGINSIKTEENGKTKRRIVGDVAFDEVVKKAGFITPVPGGVGPVTTAVLMANTLKAATIRI